MLTLISKHETVNLLLSLHRSVRGILQKTILKFCHVLTSRFFSKFDAVSRFLMNFENLKTCLLL